jgi:hypothetical protein
MMNGRQKAAFLRKNGFTKSRMQLTRVGCTYANDQGVSVTYPKGTQGGGNFLVAGSDMRFNSAFLSIGNTAKKAKEMLREARADGCDLPDPDAADFGSDAWMDELFRGIVTLNA